MRYFTFRPGLPNLSCLQSQREGCFPELPAGAITSGHQGAEGRGGLKWPEVRGRATCEYWMLKMAWDLLLASWLWVAAVIRLARPSSSRSVACLQSVTTCWDRSDGKGRKNTAQRERRRGEPQHGVQWERAFPLITTSSTRFECDHALIIDI